MHKTLRAVLSTLLISWLCLPLTAHAQPDNWVPVGGNVYFGPNPLCALVLINGQSQFTCAGAGRFDLTVPLDGNDQVTMQVFAAGFAPLRQTFFPVQGQSYRVEMERAVNVPRLEVNYDSSQSTRPGWTWIAGNVMQGGAPICALVLINGQNMFSCNANLGVFNLEVPVDAQGRVTVQVFAAGFLPFSSTTPARFTPVPPEPPPPPPPPSQPPGPGGGELDADLIGENLGQVFRLSWDFPSGYDYDIWFYVGRATQWQHVYSPDSRRSGGINVEIVGAGDSYCFQMTAVRRGDRSDRWSQHGPVVYNAYSGNESPCTP